jgi:hypothetical protein
VVPVRINVDTISPLAETFVEEHLSGKHNQRRHGWRYRGGDGLSKDRVKGMPKREREEYKRRLAGRDEAGLKPSRLPTSRLRKPDDPYEIATRGYPSRYQHAETTAHGKAGEPGLSVVLRGRDGNYYAYRGNDIIRVKNAKPVPPDELPPMFRHYEKNLRELLPAQGKRG